MSKIAQTQYPIHDLIKQRWSPRAFTDRPVEPEKLLSLLEAARWAPSCFNQQPWNFIIAAKDDPSEYDRLLSCLVEKNRRWARQAPVLLLSVAQLNFDHNDKPNRHALHDVGLAMGALLVQATASGLYVHQMAGFDRDKARQVYQIPETHEPVAALAIGYLGSPEQLPAEFQEQEKAPRSRKSLSDFVFARTWGQTVSLVDEGNREQ